MKNTLLLATLLYFALGQFSYADCNQKALNNYSADSTQFQFQDDDLAEAYEDNAEDSIKNIIKSFENSIQCSQEEGFEVNEVKCNELIPGNYLSKVCYVESDQGYFLVSKDMMENFNVTYNRFD